MCRRLRRLDASGRLQARPAADLGADQAIVGGAEQPGGEVIQVKDFAMLDAIERARRDAAAAEAEREAGRRRDRRLPRGRARRAELRVGAAALMGAPPRAVRASVRGATPSARRPSGRLPGRVFRSQWIGFRR